MRSSGKRRLGAGLVFQQDKGAFPNIASLAAGGTHAEEALVTPGDLDLLAALQGPHDFHSGEGAVQIRVVILARARNLTEMLRTCQRWKESKKDPKAPRLALADSSRRRDRRGDRDRRE